MRGMGRGKRQSESEHEREREREEGKRVADAEIQQIVQADPEADADSKALSLVVDACDM